MICRRSFRLRFVSLKIGIINWSGRRFTLGVTVSGSLVLSFELTAFAALHQTSPSYPLILVGRGVHSTVQARPYHLYQNHDR